MKRTLYLIALSVLALALAASCATAPVAQRDYNVESLLTSVNRARMDRVMHLSGRPFLLDAEIIVLESDLEMMWTNLREVGFSFDTPTVREIGPVQEDTWRRFGDTMDVRVWFERHLPEDGGLAEVETTHGTFLVVTGGEVRGLLPRIYGFTGPLEDS